MRCFLDDNFLLQNAMAVELYHNHAAKMPIFDYHCHLSPREIWEDKRFSNLAEEWLGGDHYKWRLMRACGVEERYVTGNGYPYEKFLSWAQTLARCVGNPLYVWTHLELRRFFGVTALLTPKSAPEIWDTCNKKLAEPGFTARSLILRSKVKALCTTDDPADDLAYHKALAQDTSSPVTILPTFRPEIALHPENQEFAQWIGRLSKTSDIPVQSIETLEKALENRIRYFAAAGCLLSDQSFLSPDFTYDSLKDARAAFEKAMRGERPDALELAAYQKRLMLSLGQMYHRAGWVMQLHLGVMRNLNTGKPDTGYDAVGDSISAVSLSALLNALAGSGTLPKTMIYSLNPNDNPKIASILGCFQQDVFPQKMQLGTAWWFNDHRDGMEQQMKDLANTGILAGFVGMLTDSRSFLSYTRHEYFRRILCNMLGKWAEHGEVPGDKDILGKMTEDICFNNAAAYFGL